MALTALEKKLYELLGAPHAIVGEDNQAPVEELVPTAGNVQPATRWAKNMASSLPSLLDWQQANAMGTYGAALPTGTSLQGALDISSRWPTAYTEAWGNAKGTGPQTMDEMMNEAMRRWLSGEELTPQDERLLTALGFLEGGAGDDALGWATLEQRKQEFAQSLAQDAAMQAAALAEQRRQAGLAAGQAIASMQNQAWANALPYALPTNTEFVPGYEPGGPMATMARMGGAQYTPPRATPYPQPTAAEMQEWLAEAIKRFG